MRHREAAKKVTKEMRITAEGQKSANMISDCKSTKRMIENVISEEGAVNILW